MSVLFPSNNTFQFLIEKKGICPRGCVNVLNKAASLLKEGKYLDMYLYLLRYFTELYVETPVIIKGRRGKDPITCKFITYICFSVREQL